MHESTAYQYILDEGAVLTLRKTLLRQGRIRFGEPGATTTASIEAITDRERLERLTERLLLVTTWEELLATP